MQLSLFADDMIQHRENPQDTTRKQSSSVNVVKHKKGQN